MFAQSLKAYQDAVETALDGYLALRDCPQKEGLEAMRYSLLGGGKRIRAVLVLEFARIFGVPMQQAMPFAAALEMVPSLLNISEYTLSITSLPTSL